MEQAPRLEHPSHDHPVTDTAHRRRRNCRRGGNRASRGGRDRASAEKRGSTTSAADANTVPGTFDEGGPRMVKAVSRRSRRRAGTAPGTTGPRETAAEAALERFCTGAMSAAGEELCTRADPL